MLIGKKKKAKKPTPTQLPRTRSAKSVKEHPPTTTLSALGPALQLKRVKLGLTQKAMSELCQLQIATIAKIEKGDAGVRMGTLQAYLDALNLTLLLQEKELG